jgi:hypothetical protein
MQAAIILEALLTLSTERTRQNVSDLTIATDLTTSIELQNTELNLDLAGGGNASVTMSNIVNFLFIETTYPVSVAITNGGTTTTVIVTNLLLLTGGVTQVVIYNLSTTNAPTVKVIAA